MSILAVPYKLLIGLYSVQYFSSTFILFEYKISKKKIQSDIEKVFGKGIKLRSEDITLCLDFLYRK